MQLAREEYQSLEDIVGTEYITQEPVILDTYNQVWGNKFFFGKKHSTRPAAVLLPATTEEIQAIVKVCNKYGILFKAFTAGFEYLSLSLEKEKGILLDLKRMNRILEIDPKNMRAVVEPYVSVYRMQLEAAKHGLYTGRIGVGYFAGIIATSCCHQEMTHTQLTTSSHGRNVLGVEWVLPTGDILKLGTAESSNEWYSADGPGFSLRGILRGRTGANGGHGVITKASIKLYPWYGPPEWENVREPGAPLAHGQVEKVPDGYKTFIFTFPTLDNMLEAAIEISRAEIAYSLQTGTLDTAGFTEGNDEEWAELQKRSPETDEIIRNSITLTIGAHSSREMEYREKCLFTISEKWGGRRLPELNEPRTLARAFINHVWSTGPTPMRATGDYIASSASPDGDPAWLKGMLLMEAETIESYRERGWAYRPWKVGVIWRPQENLSTGAVGGFGYAYDPWDPSALKESRDFINKVIDPQGKFKSMGVPFRGGCLNVESVLHIHQKWGPVYENYDVWLRKIKKMLDPNNVADWSAYIPAEYPNAGSEAEVKE
jgi:glycolate oxidase